MTIKYLTRPLKAPFAPDCGGVLINAYGPEKAAHHYVSLEQLDGITEAEVLRICDFLASKVEGQQAIEVRRLRATVSALSSSLGVACEALRSYANEDDWYDFKSDVMASMDDYPGPGSPLTNDYGERARAALAIIGAS